MPRVHVRAKPGRNLQLYHVCPLTGRDITRSSGTTDWEAARRVATRWELQLEAGQSTPGKTSWEAFRIKFLDEHASQLASKSEAIYTTALNAFQKHMGCPKFLADITPAVLSTFRAKLAKEAISPSTIATYLRHLQSALSWAKQLDLIHTVPKVKLPKRAGTDMKGRPLTRREFAHLRRVAKELAAEAKIEGLPRFLNLLWLSGLRLGEALQLAWDGGHVRVDLDAGRRPRIQFAAAGQKSRREEPMPIPPDLASWLALTPPAERTGLVAPLTGQRGSVMCLVNASAVISELGQRAGLVVRDGQHVTAHDLRRSFGTRWATKVRPITLQRMMRHANITTTLKFYVSLDCDDVGDELYKHRTRHALRTDAAATPATQPAAQPATAAAPARRRPAKTPSVPPPVPPTRQARSRSPAKTSGKTQGKLPSPA